MKQRQCGFSAVEGLLFLVILGVIGFASWYVWNTNKEANKSYDNAIKSNSQNYAKEYNPTIDPADFVSKVDNKFFTLTPGTKYSYKNKTAEGLETIETFISTKTEKIIGVTNVAVRDTSWLDGVLVEDTWDWYAQDKDGNVWYFGEYVSNYENGKLKDHAGSWKAGVDGAKPGIIMQAEPTVGESYRQEYYKGKAEDMGTVLSLTEKVNVPYGQYTNCMQTKDWSRVETTLIEYKYYCQDVGFLVLERENVEGTPQRVELVSVTK